LEAHDLVRPAKNFVMLLLDYGCACKNNMAEISKLEICCNQYTFTASILRANELFLPVS